MAAGAIPGTGRGIEGAPAGGGALEEDAAAATAAAAAKRAGEEESDSLGRHFLRITDYSPSTA